jgi:cytochrome c551/c552
MTRLRKVLVFVAGAAAVWSSGLLAVPGVTGAWAQAATRGTETAGAVGSWGQAIGVPGLGVLNAGGDAGVNSLSCGKPGTCAAAGNYKDQHKHRQGFVVLERKGQWDRAIEVPGLGALNKGGTANVVSVSCGPAGTCAAGGNYADGSAHRQGFVTGEKNGVWTKAIEVPGLGRLNAGGRAQVSDVSCTAAANCVAVGNYTDAAGHTQGFVASEKNGVWGSAIEVPGLATLNADGAADVTSVSCASAGNCTAGGGYTDGSGHAQGFVAGEKNGTWGQAIEVPGLGTLNADGDADVLTVSCASAGNCAAGGFYFDGEQNEQGFVAGEKNGVWGQAIDPPGLGPLNASNNDPLAFVSSVSCSSPGNCTAVGDYGWPYSWVFLASEKNGTWGKVTSVAISASIAVGRFASIGTVSCASAGNCATGGGAENMTQGGDGPAAFLTVQRNGRWAASTAVPGLKALNKVDPEEASVVSVSCGAAGDCTASGYFTDKHGHSQGFVTRGS